ncbi:hypothetical protein TW65_01153 [Stemphylium lycopersici]|uniref:Peptidase S33 tripeptidyl aminopeptidase-like C-terminal domain-containing protein n=1 Tax=Stemphylium lycopersici TaxID=183478 RepID=A0A364MVW9_STELY|nr:hypothetical protein TW65_01153 [Stemphylium lycopersici]RAR04923.1 hypothetical protein DDE83_007623 [Stemphylium lycopersici]
MIGLGSWAPLAVLLASFSNASPVLESIPGNDTFTAQNFTQVPASPDLQWTPCYDTYDCANLIVPLDYNDSDVGTTTVAFIRKNAPGNVTRDILFNPGGPGGSGVESLLGGTGDLILNITAGLYNAVSFDPRGVSNSGIKLTCFPGDTDARDAFWSTFESFTQVSGLNVNYARGLALGEWCTKANANSTARYAGTSAVVQDMMHFSTLQAAARGYERPEKALVNYYGVSYGTVIGQTLASLYPDRVGRMILDGNENGEEHYQGRKLTAVQDVDKAYEWFFTLCEEAGPEKCAFHADDVKQRFDALLAKLDEKPVILADPTFSPQSQAPQIITKAVVLTAGFYIMYTPQPGYPVLARGLAALENNDAATFFLELGPYTQRGAPAQETYILITAADAAGRSPIDNLTSFREVFETVNQTSVYAGRRYALENPLVGAGLKITPPESQTFKGFQHTNTSTPILFLNPSADPITPVANARHMATYFEGAVVLEQNSTGHTVQSMISECTLEWMVRYFVLGQMPEVGTIWLGDYAELHPTL